MYSRAEQATDDSMAHAHLTLATNTHSEYLIFIIFFRCNTICTNEPQYHVIRTSPILLKISVASLYS